MQNRGGGEVLIWFQIIALFFGLSHFRTHKGYLHHLIPKQNIRSGWRTAYPVVVQEQAFLILPQLN